MDPDGAPEPRGTGKPADGLGLDIERGRNQWSFWPPQKTKPPGVRDGNWPKSDVGKVFLASLEAAGLAPADATAQAFV